MAAELTDAEIRAVQEELADRGPTVPDQERERVEGVVASTKAVTAQFMGEMFQMMLLNMYLRYHGGDITGKVVTACYLRFETWFLENIDALFNGLEVNPITEEEVAQADLNAD